jgi:hypothetical protein
MITRERIIALTLVLSLFGNSEMLIKLTAPAPVDEALLTQGEEDWSTAVATHDQDLMDASYREMWAAQHLPLSASHKATVYVKGLCADLDPLTGFARKYWPIDRDGTCHTDHDHYIAPGWPPDPDSDITLPQKDSSL